MENIQDLLTDYLKKSNQTKEYLLSGSQFFGIDFIYNELLPQAIKENKKIVWKNEPTKGLGGMSFSLQNI